MVSEIRRLSLENAGVFSSDKRNIWAADSCLRRALEALLDVGRHILAKCFAKGVTEYEQIAEELGKKKVLSPGNATRLRTLAGYRNRMVHFYDEIIRRRRGREAPGGCIFINFNTQSLS
jgi:uncharacterized protein YutE (UPF0331/DUF86 family)